MLRPGLGKEEHTRCDQEKALAGGHLCQASLGTAKEARKVT